MLADFLSIKIIGTFISRSKTFFSFNLTRSSPISWLIASLCFAEIVSSVLFIDSQIIYLPHPIFRSIMISVRTRLEAGTITKKGKVDIDLNELRKMIVQAMKESRSLAKSMKSADFNQIAEKINKETQTGPQHEPKDGDVLFVLTKNC